MAETKHQTAYRTVKGPDGPPLNHRVGHPDARGPALVPAAQAVLYPAWAHIKKPVSGKPATGAHFVSFNFPNSLICAAASSFATGRCVRDRVQSHRRLLITGKKSK
jgi:hypothetical protein